MRNVASVSFIQEYEDYVVAPEVLEDPTFRDELIALGLNPETGRGKGTVTGFEVDFERSTSAQLLDPRQGYFVSGHVEKAGQWLRGTFDYTEFMGEVRGYVPFGSRIVWANRARAATLSGPSAALIPFYKRYFVGGSTSVRGWGRYQVSPLTPAGNPIGATSLNAMLRFQSGTAGGVMTAVAAAREGLRVALLEPGRHLGGMVSGGLGWTDHGKKEVIGGYALEFFRRVGRKYGEPITWYFEPHVAEAVLNEMVHEAGVEVFLQHRLRERNGVTCRGPQIETIVVENGASARVFYMPSFEQAAAVNESDGTGGTHHGDLRGGPGEVDVGAHVLRAHVVVGATICLASDDCDLAYGSLAIGVKQFCAAADDAVELLIGSWQEAGDVHEREDRDIEGVARANETGCLF